ncbi:hypothetical protein GCM10008965_32090 [Methylorubrum aminovorans]|nr:hypothetical protein GCM10025880_13310 [Methylorubrum aminovorans]
MRDIGDIWTIATGAPIAVIRAAAALDAARDAPPDRIRIVCRIASDCDICQYRGAKPRILHC